MLVFIPAGKYEQNTSNETSNSLTVSVQCRCVKTLLWKRQNKSTFGIKYFTLINNRIVLRTKTKKSTNKPRLWPKFVQNNYNDLHIQSLQWDEHKRRWLTGNELWIFKITKTPPLFIDLLINYQTGPTGESKPWLLLLSGWSSPGSKTRCRSGFDSRKWWEEGASWKALSQLALAGGVFLTGTVAVRKHHQSRADISSIGLNTEYRNRIDYSGLICPFMEGTVPDSRFCIPTSSSSY